MLVLSALITLLTITSSSQMDSGEGSSLKLMIKTAHPMDVGVDVQDRWILMDAEGNSTRLPDGAIRFASAWFTPSDSTNHPVSASIGGSD